MNQRTAINILLAMIGAVIVFHIGIIAKLIPYHIAWGGRLQNDGQMYVFETVSILINLLLILVLLMKGAYIKNGFSQKFIRVVLWIFLVLFVLNTLGNLFAKTNFEKFFALVTFGFSLLLLKILYKRKT